MLDGIPKQHQAWRILIWLWCCCCRFPESHVEAIITTHNNTFQFHSTLPDIYGVTSFMTPSCRRFMNSRKYQSECMERPTVVYPLLVTALGGSGTHAVSKQLRDHGYRIGHEEIETDGSVVRTKHNIFSSRFVSIH